MASKKTGQTAIGPETGKQSLRKAEATRLEILIAAAKLFSHKGYTACTLREIADKVGMKAGSVYYHFGSKEEILDEVLNTSLRLISDAVTEALAAMPEDAPTLEKLDAAIRAHVQTFLSDNNNTTAFMRVYEHLPPVMKRRSRVMRHAYAEIWYGLLEEGQASGEIRSDIDPKLVVPFLLAGLSRVIEWYNPQRMRIDQVCDMIVRTYLDGGLSTMTPTSLLAASGATSPQRIGRRSR